MTKLVRYFASMCVVSACEDGDIRLSGGRHYREGRVEVCRNQQWGRVCDDEWDESDAAVAYIQATWTFRRRYSKNVNV